MINRKVFRVHIVMIGLVGSTLTYTAHSSLLSSIERQVNRFFSRSTSTHVDNAYNALANAQNFRDDLKSVLCLDVFSLDMNHHQRIEQSLLMLAQDMIGRWGDSLVRGTRTQYGQSLQSAMRELEKSAHNLSKRLRSITNGAYAVTHDEPTPVLLASIVHEIEACLVELRQLERAWQRYGEYVSIAQEILLLDSWRIPLTEITAETIGLYVCGKIISDPYPFVAYEKCCAQVLKQLEQMNSRLLRQAMPVSLLQSKIQEIRNAVVALRFQTCIHPAYKTQMTQREKERDRQNEAHQRELDRNHESRQRTLDRENEARQRELDRRNMQHQNECASCHVH